MKLRMTPVGPTYNIYRMVRNYVKYDLKIPYTPDTYTVDSRILDVLYMLQFVDANYCDL